MDHEGARLGRVRRARWTLRLASVGLVAAACLAPTARAGTFQVEACAGAPGNVNHAWAPFISDAAHFAIEATCLESAGPLAGGPSTRTSGLSASDALGFGGGVPAGTAGWRFTAPAGTAIIGAALERDLYKRNDNTWLLFVSDQSGALVRGQNCTIDPSVVYQCEVSGTLTLTGLNDTALSIGILCTTGCVAGFSAHDVRADLDRAVVTIFDPTPPAAPAVSGPAAQASWHSASVPLSVSSSDTVGISRVQVAGPTGDVLAGASQPCDYTYTTPCPQAAAVPLLLDTRRLPDGIDPVTITATDAAQNTTATTIAVMVANNPPPPPVLAGLPDGPTTRASVVITAGLRSVGVPIAAVGWSLCGATCGPTQAVTVPSGASTATFTVTAPADGAYTIKAYAVDAAGHRSSLVTGPLAVDRAGSGAAVTLPAGANAGASLPPAVSPGVRLLVSVHRRGRRQLEVDVRTRPKRAGRVHLRLAFAGHRSQHRTLVLHAGGGAVLVDIPPAATQLTLALTGLGTHATRRVRLAAA